MLPPPVATLRVLPLRASFVALDPIQLPPYPGSTLRGVFGRAFRRAACLLNRQECPSCMLNQRCPYAVTFESIPPPDSPVMAGASRAPHPFVLDPADITFIPSGGTLELGLTLLGPAVDLLPYHLLALEGMGGLGFGKTRARARLDLVTDPGPDGAPVPLYDVRARRLSAPPRVRTLGELSRLPNPVPRRLTLDFQTPVRLLEDRRPPDRIDYPLLLRAALRRLCLLAGLYGPGPAEVDRDALLKKASAVRTVSSDLRWHDWERWSSRQGIRMKLGGFLGRIEFEGNLAETAPWILAGSVVHLGKNGSFGLGKYSCFFSVTESDPARREER